MTRHRTSTKIIHEGTYAVEVTIELEYSDESWSPTMSPADAFKLESARPALQRGDIAEAATYGKVFELRPVVLE